MPTPESRAAFAKLVEKREHLHEVSKKLHHAMPNRASEAGDRRYKKLQAEWDKALRELRSATEEFSATINDL